MCHGLYKPLVNTQKCRKNSHLIPSSSDYLPYMSYYEINIQNGYSTSVIFMYGHMSEAPRQSSGEINMN